MNKTLLARAITTLLYRGQIAQAPEHRWYGWGISDEKLLELVRKDRIVP